MAKESNRWAMLIGVDRYHESLGPLKFAGADCRALCDTLISEPLGFPEDQVLLLDDAQPPERRPTFANIHSFLGSWLAAPKEGDLVFFYFAGHGRFGEDSKTYLAPGDATLASIHTLGIPLSNVQDLLERCKAKRKLLVLDACHSGAGRDVYTMPGGMADALAQGSGFYTISSCGAKECSHEWDEKGHGVFSHFLTEALRGGCPPAADGRLTVDHLYEWVHDRVAKWAAQHRCSQTPQRFAKGAGTIILTQSNPDHAALAEQYRRELEETKARLAEIELRETRERLAKEGARRKTETIERLTVLARTLVAETPRLKGAALRTKWKHLARTQLGDADVASVDLDAILLEQYGHLPQSASAKGEEVTIRFVFVPASVDSTVYLDDEPISKNKSVTVAPSRHIVRVIPLSLEWGTVRMIFKANPGEERKIVIRLKRAASMRALASCLCTILAGCFIALIGFSLPTSSILAVGPDARGPYSGVGWFASILVAWVFGYLLAGIIQLCQGIKIKMIMLLEPGHGVLGLEPPDGLLYTLALATTLSAWLLGVWLPFRYVFMGWAIGTATIAGILFCLVPWHGHYRSRDVT